MKNSIKRFTEEELIKHEQPVTAKDLLEEIKPLLEDYFIGDISFDGKGIVYTLPNGQKFILKAEETAA